MKRNAKHIFIIAILIGLMAFKVGVMKGSAENHEVGLSPINFKADLSAVINETPVNKQNQFRANVTITAYSSRPEETDDTPFITASGTHVRDGVVAANWLPIGTKVRIPALFGDKIFVVEDRMHRRNSEKLDIWFAETNQALKFGVKKARVEIL